MLTPNALIQHRYLITQQVGDSTSAVFQAIDLATRKTVALKLLAIQASQQAAFERAARRLWNLRHPNLPILHSYFAEHDRAFLTMDLLPGDDLAAAVGPGKRVESERVERWADQLLDALDYIHTLQPPLLHGNINPRSLKLKADDQIVLLDFELPQSIAESSAKHAGSFSAQFRAPENAAGADARSDLFALAGTLYYLLTGTAPITATERATAVAQSQPDPIKSIQALNSRVPAGLGAAIMRALALDPAQRPSSAADMRAIIYQPIASIPSRRRPWLLRAIIGALRLPRWVH